MFVIKRDGNKHPMQFDKITQRIKKIMTEFNINKIDPITITQLLVQRMITGINTSQIDELACQIIMGKVQQSQNYGKLAACLAISNHHKTTSDSFLETVEVLYNNKDPLGESAPLVSDMIFNFTKKYTKEIQSIIDYNRDYLIDYFGFSTLKKAYLLKVNKNIIERPQHMFMRVALGIHADINKPNFEIIKRTYDSLSNQEYMHATPTLFHAGTPRPQLSSCFLIGTEDSVEGIYGTITDCAKISKWAGGIGIHIHDIRSEGSYIRKTGGYSDGIMPMLKVYDSTARYINQSGKRQGSFAMYLEPWHADILKFLHAKRAQGVEEERARDLFYALWVPDLFMERVRDNGTWSLMCPDLCPGLSDVYGDEFKTLYEKYENEGRYKTQMEARKLWENIITCQIESGVPYMCYKDASNKKSNQQNIGVIKSSNLCVSGNTKIITNDGVFNIQSLQDQEVDVWNGFEFSKVTINKTGENQGLHKIQFSNGEELLCTPYHKFYIQEGYSKSQQQEIRAEDLQKDMKIIKYNFPVLDNENEFPYAYTHGLFCADGTYNIPAGDIRQCSFTKPNDTNFCSRHLYQKGYDFSQYNSVITNKTKCNAVCGITSPKLYLYGEKKSLIKYIESNHHNTICEDENKITIYLPQDLPDKYFVPFNHSLSSKLRWLEGYLDGDGCILTEKNHQTQTIQCVSVNLNFIKDIKTLLNTLGCDSKISLMRRVRKQLLPDGKDGMKEYICKEQYRLCITAYDTQKLLELGFNPKRLQLEKRECNRSAKQFITVEKVEKNVSTEDTYCFNEPKRHYGVFNGILTGQCAEIKQVSTNTEPSVCNLASISIKAMLKNPDVSFDDIKIITKPDCFYCKLLKYVLNDRGIIYEELDLANTTYNHLIPDDYKTVPRVIVNENKFLGGFWDTWKILQPVIDHEKLMKAAYDLTINLNKIIDINYYPLEGARSTNINNRPIGIGVQGLADTFAEMLIQFDSEEAMKLNKEIFETIYYGAMLSSIDLAKVDGPYSTYEGSPLSKGQFQFNLWGMKDDELSGLWDWGYLRNQLLKYGARNSLLTALMPTASTAQITGNNECFEPFTSNMYTRSTIAGEFTVINNILFRYLENIGMWNKNIEDQIIYHRGSVQNIKELPTDFKKVFKTVWEISQKKYIEMSAHRGPFICQSQSLNIWFEKPTFQNLYKSHMLGWSLGLKTGSYYVRGLPSGTASRLGMKASVEKKITDDCESCSA
jgi:ribonucleoside-diphosphate reductase alpha chain